MNAVEKIIKRLAKAVLILALFSPRFSPAQTLKPEDVYQNLLPSVMTLHVKNAAGETYIGTAFLALDKNTAVTAWHVVSDATNVTATFSDGSVFAVAGLIDKDESHDLALIRLDSPHRPRAHLSFAKPAVGSRAYVIGAPKGFEFSITDGLISQIQKIRGDDQYQVSCPISGGNSGGPVVNERGEVVGVTAWTQKDAQNVSFAIPAGFLQGLNSKRSLIAWTDLTKSNIKSANTSSEAVKTSESRGSVSELKHYLNSAAGDRVTITVSRGGNEKKFEVVLPKDFAK